MSLWIDPSRLVDSFRCKFVTRWRKILWMIGGEETQNQISHRWIRSENIKWGDHGRYWNGNFGSDWTPCRCEDCLYFVHIVCTQTSCNHTLIAQGSKFTFMVVFNHNCIMAIYGNHSYLVWLQQILPSSVLDCVHTNIAYVSCILIATYRLITQR